jgi:hypothetical protein
MKAFDAANVARENGCTFMWDKTKHRYKIERRCDPSYHNYMTLKELKNVELSDFVAFWIPDKRD